jgi:ribonuclease Z
MTDLLRIIFLGTGAAAPSPARRSPALIIQRENELILCDCGEGTQVRLQQAGLSPTHVHTILLSHLHGDHLFGLPGFLSSQQLFGRTAPLTIYGPCGLQQFLTCIESISKYRINFPMQVIELDEESTTFHEGVFDIVVLPLRHSSPCLGYRLQEPAKSGKFDAAKAEELGLPNGLERRLLQQGESVQVNGRTVQPSEVVGPPIAGRVITYCTDTLPCANTLVLAHEADVLIHDATFSDAYADRAEESYHCTSRQAAQIAQEAHVGRLMLWHLSIRVHGDEEAALLAQAREVFPDSYLPNDLDSVVISRKGAEQ